MAVFFILPRIFVPCLCGVLFGAVVRWIPNEYFKVFMDANLYNYFLMCLCFWIIVLVFFGCEPNFT